MRKLYSTRKRLIGLGLMGALVVALAVVGSLWGFSQTARADPDGPVSLVHVNTDGTVYTGNPYCPGTVWDDGKVVSVDPVDYCNNITCENHMICAVGFDPDIMSPYPAGDPDGGWTVQNAAGANADTVLFGYVDSAYCVVIHSSTPGETRVTLTYTADTSIYTTPAVIKEWRKLHDTVILKDGDLDKVTMPDSTRVYQPGVDPGKALLPKDADGDGDRDTDDEHAMDHNGEVQNHSVVVDEVSKGIRSLAGPIWLVDVVHGVEKPDDPVFHDPVEGAVVLAFIDSPKHCTYFTNPTFSVDSFFTVPANDRYYGTAMVGITNQFGQFVGPLPWPVGAQFSDEALAEAAAHLLSEGMSQTGEPAWFGPHLGVHVDTSCEEQATITFKVGYPGHVGSAPQFPEPESVTINWVTLELLKQPQIRWAGEEIVLATRWALPNEWYPNAGTGEPEEDDECLNALDDDADTLVNDGCPAEGVAEEGSECLDDEDAEEDDPADGLVNDGCPVDTAGVQAVCPLATSRPTFIGWYDPWAATYAITHHVNYVKKDPSPGALEGAYVDEDGDGSLDTLAFMGASEARGDIDNSCVSKALYDSEVAGQVDVEAKLVEATWACDAEYMLVDDDLDSTDEYDCIDEDPVDGLDNDTGLCATDPEEGDECLNALDDDGDGYVNDGCPTEPESEGTAETSCDDALDNDDPDEALDPETGTECDNALDDDYDGVVNDGCAQVGDGAVNDGCPADGNGEDLIAGACDNDIDDDEDGWVNDGCPQVGATDETDTQCGNATDDDVADIGAGTNESDITDACDNDVDDDYDGMVNDGCPTVGDGYVNDGCPTIGDGLIDEDPVNAVGINYDPDSHKFTCEYPLFDEFGWPRDWVVRGDAELQTEVLINKHPFLVWYLKIYQTKLENIPLKDGVGREDHNAGEWAGEDPTGEGLDAETLNVSQDALLRVTVKGFFHGANNSARGAVCVDMDGDGNGLEGEDATPPGEPYPLLVYELGCPDSADEAVEHGHWVLPDDFVTMASALEPFSITPGLLASLDVMSDIGDTPKTKTAVGPKSTLDSHDSVTRPWIPCQVDACPRKTVDPDGEITVADAIMPPLKITAGIPGAAGEHHAKDAGFLKGADKDDDVGIESLYQKIMIPADPEIPPFISGGGYDWDSWFCRIEDANIPSPEDPDADGWSNWWDNCPTVYNPNQYDIDGDWVGDVCDDDIDGDGIANATDACDYDPTNTCTGEDSDGDGIVDEDDNCPFDPNADQNDFDDDGDGDVCDLNPFVKWISNIVPCFAFPANYYGLQMGPYEFYHVMNILPVTDCPDLEDELCNANIGNQLDQGPEDTTHPRAIEFYTDNRGMGFFFANGDYNLDFGCPVDPDTGLRVCNPDGCRLDPLSGAPDCSLGDVVGESNIKVIGQYPYTRAPEKLRTVISNTVVKTWEWGGFKEVTGVRLDSNHTAIIAHVKDRDGYCKWDVDVDETPMEVTFSPSEHPVEGEEITFQVVAGGQITWSPLGISPNATFNPSPIPDPLPLVDAVVTDWDDGTWISETIAVALAEDVRLLEAILKAQDAIDDETSDRPECQAWIIVEHEIGVDPEVSVTFSDPEGDVSRHYPPEPSDVLTIALALGWNDSCYVDLYSQVEVALDSVMCAEGLVAVPSCAEGLDLVTNDVATCDDPATAEVETDLAGLACDDPETADVEATAPLVLAAYRYDAADAAWRKWFPGNPEVSDLGTDYPLGPYDQLFILMSAKADWEQYVTTPPVDVPLEGASDEVAGAWNSVCYVGADKATEEATRDIEDDFLIMYTLTSQGWLRYVPARPEIPDTLKTLHRFESVILLVTAEGGTTWEFDP